MEAVQRCVIGAGEQLVEDVEGPLAGRLLHHPRLLQQVAQNVASDRGSLQQSKRSTAQP